MEKPLIKLAIADDHRLIREGITKILSKQERFSIIIEASNGEELLNKIPDNYPDVLLLDIRMPVMDGISALKIIREKYPTIRTIMLSAFLDDVYVAQCLDYGINGYLSKDFMNPNQLVQAIEVANQFEMYATNLLNSAFLKKYLVENHMHNKNILPDFTMEELKLIELLSLEKTTEEIAGYMFLSKRSVEVKREKLKEKANVKTVGGLMLYCMKRGLLN